MSICDWLWAADLVAAGVMGVGYVWLSAVCWRELAKRKRPAVRRHPGHYGTQEVK